MKTYILDDEHSSIEVIEIYLSKYFSTIEITGKHTDPIAAVKEINLLKPDLLIIDIQMPDLNGFEVLELISKPRPMVIFLTAYNHYAIEAIKFSAMYYLVKPINLQELKQAIAKVEENYKSNVYNRNIEQLLFNAKLLEGKNTKIALNQNDCIEYVNINDILRLEADNNYSRVFLQGGKSLLISKTLKDFEQILDSDIFFRVHQSHLINIFHMKKYIKTDGGMVELSDGIKIPVSRTKKDILNKKIQIG